MCLIPWVNTLSLTVHKSHTHTNPPQGQPYKLVTNVRDWVSDWPSSRIGQDYCSTWLLHSACDSNHCSSPHHLTRTDAHSGRTHERSSRQFIWMCSRLSDLQLSSQHKNGKIQSILHFVHHTKTPNLTNLVWSPGFQNKTPVMAILPFRKLVLCVWPLRHTGLRLLVATRGNDCSHILAHKSMMIKGPFQLLLDNSY